MAAVAVLSAPATAMARRTHEPGDGVPESIRYYESVAMMSPAQTAAARRGGAGEPPVTEIAFATLGREFSLTLEPSSPYAPGATVRWIDDAGEVVEPPSGGPFYRGGVAGDPSSWVRITRHGEALAGVIATDDEIYFLEPASRFFGAEAAGETLAYRLSDTDSTWEPGSCAAREPSPREQRRLARKGRSAARVLSDIIGGGAITAAAAGQLTRAEVGMVADFEYFSRHGAQSADHIAEVIHNVDGIYQAEVGVTIELATTVIYTTVNDPFSNATNPTSILNEFKSWKNANDDSPAELLWGTDYAHLMTGRNLDGSVIGIAYVGAICGQSAVGVDQDFTTAINLITLLVAHEMGHNFGAPHDNQGGSPCASMPGTFIMNPSISSSLQQKFSSCSKDLIASFLADASCFDMVNPTPTPTPAPLTLNPLPSPIVVGGALTLTGTGFTSGSRVNLFVNNGGVTLYGPFTPTSVSSTTLVINPLSSSVQLGNGFASVQVVNTDQNFVASEVQSQYLFGSATWNIPTITKLNDVGLRPLTPGVPVAAVETVVPPGSVLTISGTGFNNALVNLYTATGYVGPLTPLAGATSTRLQVQIPPSAPTGPLSVQVVNSPYMGNVVSNAVAAALGAAVTITQVSQNGNTVIVKGTGFSPLSVINFWAKQPNGATAFLGGYNAAGAPNIPLTLISDTEFRFTIPSGVASGMAYVQVVNPPFIPFSTSSGDPDGWVTLVLP